MVEFLFERPRIKDGGFGVSPSRASTFLEGFKGSSLDLFERYAATWLAAKLHEQGGKQTAVDVPAQALPDPAVTLNRCNMPSGPQGSPYQCFTFEYIVSGLRRSFPWSRKVTSWD